jgi:hypothetical protein
MQSEERMTGFVSCRVPHPFAEAALSFQLLPNGENSILYKAMNTAVATTIQRRQARQRALASLAQHGPAARSRAKGKCWVKQRIKFFPRCRRPARSRAERTKNPPIRYLYFPRFAKPQKDRAPRLPCDVEKTGANLGTRLK